MWAKPSCFLFLLCSLAVHGQELMRSQEPLEALDSLSQILDQALSISPLPRPDMTVQAMNDALERLESVLTSDSLAYVSREGSQVFESDIQGEELFGTQPRLPAEDKHDGHWKFETQRFDLKAAFLFIHALTFKASRTIRLQRVRLILANGKSHSFEFPDPDGTQNGQEFEKRTYLKWMKLVDSRGRPKIGRLEAIEIDGSAQDGNFFSVLEFKVQVPDYELQVPTEALSIIAKMKRHWRNPEQAARNLTATSQHIQWLREYLREYR